MKLALPTPELMRLSVASADPEKFLSRGASSFQKILDVLEGTGLSLKAGQNVLEWGCGCGRIARHFINTNVNFYGIDINQGAISWCQIHLEFGSFHVCQLSPPTDFETGMFDVIYAGSVLTHLSADMQFQWMAELHRLLKPNGRLILTFHGSYYIAKHYQREGFYFSHVGSGMFAEIGNNEGSNSYGAYQTREATREIFFPFRELLHIQMHDILGGQDTIVFSKTPELLTTEFNDSDEVAAVVMSGKKGSGRIVIEARDRDILLGVATSPCMLPNQFLIMRIPLEKKTLSNPTVTIREGNGTIKRIYFITK